MSKKPIVGRNEWGLVLTVDPEEFSPEHTHTVEQEVDGVVQRWTDVRPQKEEDGCVRIYLPITRQ